MVKDHGWREQMTVRLDVNGMMALWLGEAGVKEEAIASLLPRMQEIHAALLDRRRSGALPFYDLPYQDVTPVKALAEAARKECDVLVVLGIGGSALGARALYQALLPSLSPQHPALHVADNIDPVSFGALLERLNLSRTLFNVISKSGETAETMAQFLIVRQLLQDKLGAAAVKQRLIVTTDAKSGYLRPLVDREGWRDLVIPAGVGGRFSVFTPVGLFPAAVVGIDIEELLAGAAWMDERCREAELWRNPASLFAALQFLSQKPIVVMMPYADGLAGVSEWFCQLWAESLGKEKDRQGKSVHVGQTPVRALGTTDQHSQVQLYAEGPNDKVVVFLRVDDPGREVTIPDPYPDIEGCHYLSGVGLGVLLRSEQHATQIALAKKGRLTCIFTLPAVNAFTLGQLLYLLEVATAVSGELYGIDAFDQPGVEEGKRLTYGMMGRAGFAEKKAEVDAWEGKKQGRYVV
ncbi:MAG TPA: glucose-6-phosphate isomerase [Methylomirabilota bacterium]|jgi:glucose-6-phosphate isomerase|nr:glucose-6-phosphate isomerase [Methylomirabilota bacterium]